MINHRKFMAFSQIFLMVSFSFAVAVIMSSEVDGQEVAGGVAPEEVAGAEEAAAAEEVAADAATKAAAEEAARGAPTTLGGFVKSLFAGTTFGTNSALAVGAGSILSGAVWGGVVYGGVKLLGRLFGLEQGMTNALAAGGGAGVFAGMTAHFLGTTSVAGGAPLFPSLATWAPWIGIGVGVAVFIMTYKKEKIELVRFTCDPWEPPTGGNQCDACNGDELMPCSAYRCKSLGQACELVNEGVDGAELCVWTNKDDVTAPIISQWDEAVSPEGLSMRRDGNGYRIIEVGAPNGCLEAFSSWQFGIRTNEPSQCKIDLEMKDTFEEMGWYFGESNLYGLEHEQTRLGVPNPFAEPDSDIPDIHNGGVYTLYVRCRDANGNGEDSVAIPFRFCVQQGPDTRAPLIEGFSIPDGSPVQYEINEIKNLDVYTNEPAECRWTRSNDKNFDDMENEMSCDTRSRSVNANLQFTCKDDVGPISDRANNLFYFRCKDQPSKPENERNAMQAGVALTLRGTEPLTIQTVGPNGEILGATKPLIVNLTVETMHGADDGSAICYYKIGANDGLFNVAMLGARTAMHNQPYPFSPGTYNVYFRCIDAGGNAVEDSTSLTVIVDENEPLIARVYKDGNYLKVITNEEAVCKYSLSECNYEFETAPQMTYENSAMGERIIHMVEWNEDKTYYVKCEDFQLRRVAPDECSIIARGTAY